MWGSTYYSRQYVERHKALPVVLSRLHGPTNNGHVYTSTYGVWNDEYGSKGNGLWDDVLFQMSQRGNGIIGNTSQKSFISQPNLRDIVLKPQFQFKAQKSFINQPNLRDPVLKRQFRFKALATAKKSGCGPNCKKSRCAATVEYAKPHCIANYRKRRQSEDGLTTHGSERNIYSTMANICFQDRICEFENHDMTMGLRNLKKVNESGNLEDLLKGEQNCKRNCGECSDAPQDVAINNPENTNNTQSNDMKSPTTRTVGSNTEKYFERVDYEFCMRVLKNVDNNIMSGLLPNTTTPIPRMKLYTPIPRVALLKLPKPEPYKHLNKMAKKMIKSVVERKPLSLTSQRIPPQKMPPQTQKLMPPGNLAPQLFTPPTSIPFTQTPIPQSESINQEKAQLETRLQPFQPIQNPTLVEINSNQSSERSSKQSSKQSSKANSLITTISECDTSSNSNRSTPNEQSSEDSITEMLTPMHCYCKLCGKSENITDGSQLNSSIPYNNNPLYSTSQSLTRWRNPSTSTGTIWRMFYTLLEVLVWLMLGGVLTMGLIPYVETTFRAYVADFGRCSGKGLSNSRTGSELTTDGIKSGVVKWVTCMMDDSRTTLTPLR